MKKVTVVDFILVGLTTTMQAQICNTPVQNYANKFKQLGTLLPTLNEQLN
ncbi:MAG: hypothetical protein IPN82_16130 [Chitinophagaceae bacterium]|nr:hypothetical protein [Chitinophagaceae bacterium]